MTEYTSEKGPAPGSTQEPGRDLNPPTGVQAEKDDDDHSSTARESVADTLDNSFEGAAPGHQLDVELGRVRRHKLQEVEQYPSITYDTKRRLTIPTS
jgi:hypothetical protein